MSILSPAQKRAGISELQVVLMQLVACRTGFAARGPLLGLPGGLLSTTCFTARRSLIPDGG